MRSILLCLGVLLASCDGGSSSNTTSHPPQGRAETQSIRSTEAIGYAGGAVADRVDETLNAVDARHQQLETQEE